MVRTALAALAALAVLHAPARAEVSEVTVAQQYGVSFLPLMVMERNKLIEKHAAAAGIPGLRVNWPKVAGPSPMNDGLLSGTIQFAAQGTPSLITLWDKTRGNVGIKGVASMTTYPLYLVTNNPAVRTLRDFGPGDKIAVPSVKISTQAIMLQIAAAKEWGPDSYARLDPYTISLSHPDAMLALTNNTAGVNAHFSSSPFYEQEIKLPGVHLVTTNYEIMGGPATAVVITSSGRFRDANPRVFRAFLDAEKEAIDTINADKPAAARLYLDAAHDTKTSVDDVVAIISNKDYAYTLQPQKVLATAQFMARVGSIRQAPREVGEMFFPEVAGVGGD